MPPQRHLSDRQRKKERKTPIRSKKIKLKRSHSMDERSHSTDERSQSMDDVASVHNLGVKDVSTETMMLQLKSAHAHSHANLCRMLRTAIEYGVQQGALKTRLVRTIDFCDSDGSVMDVMTLRDTLGEQSTSMAHMWRSPERRPAPLSMSGLVNNVVAFLSDSVTTVGKMFTTEDAPQNKRLLTMDPEDSRPRRTPQPSTSQPLPGRR